jgi:hypothetical protein
VSRKRDIKEFDQASREVGLTEKEQREASEALHADKQSIGMKDHMPYRDLVRWLRQWKED